MPIKPLTPEIIAAAIEGFEAQMMRIDSQIAELRGLLNHQPATPEAEPRKGRKFSAAARQRMREAQRIRWQRVRGESVSLASEKPKRRLSPAGRKAIQEALRRRWAQKRAEASTANTGAKKAGTRSVVVKPAPAKTAKKRVAPKTTAVKSAAVKKPGPKTPAAEKKTSGSVV